jgi:hypothetical protein
MITCDWSSDVCSSDLTPSLPVLNLANLLYPPLLTDGHVDIAFRFTPVGVLGSWRIDDVFVDPFKGA